MLRGSRDTQTGETEKSEPTLVKGDRGGEKPSKKGAKRVNGLTKSARGLGLLAHGCGKAYPFDTKWTATKFAEKGGLKNQEKRIKTGGG